MVYDVIIIGAGPGGYVAAERAAQAGKSVLIVEKDNLGGVCLNWGCIPTKSLLNSAKTYKHTLEAQNVGVKIECIEFDLSAAMEWKEEIVATLRKGIAYLMKKNKVEIVKGTGKIVTSGIVEVDGTRYQASNIIIATGSRPVIPPIPGADQDHVVTSSGVLTLETLPETVAVIGGGVIGMEFASFFSALGKKVAVFEMLPEILPMMEPVLAEELRKNHPNIDFHLETMVEIIEGNTVVYSNSHGTKKAQADLVLVAVGRVPNVEDLGLEQIKVDVTRKGIVVDEHMRTNIPGVYAIGDVTGTSLLAHSASRMGEVAVNHMCALPDRMRYDAIPWAVYTIPEAAGCGLTLTQAREAGYEAQLVSYSYRGNGRNLVENGAGVGTSLQVVDKNSGRILGIHLLGAYASENIATAAVILECEVRSNELKEIVFPHPTVSEVIREATFKY